MDGGIRGRRDLPMSTRPTRSFLGEFAIIIWLLQGYGTGNESS